MREGGWRSRRREGREGDGNERVRVFTVGWGGFISAGEKTNGPDLAVRIRSDGQESLSSEEAPWGLKVYLFR